MKYAALLLVPALLLANLARSEPGHVFRPLTDAERQEIRVALPSHAQAIARTARRVLILFRTQGFVHQSIPYANEALKALGEVTGAYSADLSDGADALSAKTLSRYDAVILNNTTHLSPSPGERTALLEFVRSGKGLVGIHAASDSFYTWPEGQALLGGVFNSHPWTADDTVAVKLDDPDSPLTAAFNHQGFWVRDEIYQITGPYSRDRVHELLSLDMSRPENARKPDSLVRDDNDFPIAWIRREGRGRVFYTSLGHNPVIYRTRAILEHYLAGIQYALGDLSADATPTAELAHVQSPSLAPERPANAIDSSAK